MSVDLAPLKAVISKMEADDIADLEAALIPAVFAELGQWIPAPYLPLEQAISAALQPALQAAFAQLLAKVPSL